MNSVRTWSLIARLAGPLCLRRLGLFLLVVPYKALVCLLLMEMSFEGGLELNGSGEGVEELAELHHAPPRRGALIRRSGVRADGQYIAPALCRGTAGRPSGGHCVPASLLLADPASRPNSPRDPPARG